MAEKDLLKPPKALKQSIRFRYMSPEEIAAEYLNYPMVPDNKMIQIDTIGIINSNPIMQGLLKYEDFRKLDPMVYTVSKDYEDDDQVTPALIVSNKQKYRVSHELWKSLYNVMSAIVIKQNETGKKILPTEVFIDKNNQWIDSLLYLTTK